MASVDPALVAALVERMRRALQAAADAEIRFEVYRRVRVQLAQAGYGRDDEYAIRLAAEYAIREIEHEYSGEPNEEEAGIARTVWSFVDPMSDHYVLGDRIALDPVAARLFESTRDPAQEPGYGILMRFNMIFNLWLRAINHEASMDRIGYVWLVADPFIHVLLICFMPLFVNPRNIMDMPSFTFGIVGACFWLTFRTSLLGAMFGGGGLQSQMEHPPVRQIDVMAARALNALIIYATVGACMIGLAMWLELAYLPHDPVGFAFFYLLNWIFGLSYGTVIHSLLIRYPGVRRINGFFMRVLAIMSGLFYASEQLPQEISSIFLYNPLLHIVQFGRSAWFREYTTTDASLTYVFFFSSALILLALVCRVIDDRWPGQVRP